MAIEISEKTFLEKLASMVPGLAGYREREARRETDRRLREFLAGRLDEARTAVDALRRTVMDSGELKLMNDVARLEKALQKSASTLRFADYGYSGLFDQLKIREAELDRIYAFDTALVDEVVELGAKLARAAADRATGETLADLARAAEGLDGKIVRRKEIFETPGA